MEIMKILNNLQNTNVEMVNIILLIINYVILRLKIEN